MIGTKKRHFFPAVLLKEDFYMDWGMQNRLGQLIRKDGHCFFLPIDHGYFQGPTTKLEKPGETIDR